MKIAVTDANIFIDLIHIGLIDELFGIEVEVHTTANVVDELNAKQQQTLLRFTKKSLLTVHMDEGFDIPEAIVKSKKLSASDKTVFGLALQLNAFLLTGDGLLRQVSGAQKIEVHGMLWLFDQFLEKKLITRKRAVQQLKSLQAYNKRLPVSECERRITDWS